MKKGMIIVASLVVVLIAILLLMSLSYNKTYVITFDSNGGSKVEVVKVKKGNMVEKPKDPTKTGYGFIGWMYNEKAFDFSTEINSDITLVAEWQEVKIGSTTFTVIFDSDGGTTILNQIVENGDKVAMPVAPVKDGYDFIGWYDGDVEYDFTSETNDNLTLTARWEEQVKNAEVKDKSNNKIDTSVTINGDNNSNSSQNNNSSTNNSDNTKNSNNSTTNTTNNTSNNVVDNTNNNSTSNTNDRLLGDVNNDGKVSNKDVTRLMQHTHGINSLSSSDLNVADVNNDGEIDDLDAAILFKYVSSGSFTLPYKTGTKYSAFYNYNGGEEVYNYLNYSDFTLPFVISNPTKDGYIFIGWTGSNGRNPEVNVEVPKGTIGNLYYIANWRLIGDVNNDGRVNSKDYNSLIQYFNNMKSLSSEDLIVADVNKDGEIDDVDALVLFKYSASDSISLPYNSGSKYTITYDLNGGIVSGYNYRKYAPLNLSFILSNPTKDGYTFIGWTGSNGNNPEVKVVISEGTTGNLNYVANWRLYGDINNDSKVNNKDYSALEQYLNNTRTLSDTDLLVADMNSDGKVDSVDSEILFKYVSSN